MYSFQTPYGSSNSGEEKMQFTPFWGGPKPGCLDGLRAEIIESHNFFVLSPILVKFHIRTRLIESFPRFFGRGGAPKKSCTSRQFTPYAN